MPAYLNCDRNTILDLTVTVMSPVYAGSMVTVVGAVLIVDTSSNLPQYYGYTIVYILSNISCFSQQTNVLFSSILQINQINANIK